MGPITLYPGLSSPATPGEVIILYGNGFGPTTPPVTGGSPDQSGILPQMPTITLGGIPAAVQFAGLISPGLYQFNVTVPTSTQDGDNLLAAHYMGFSTQMMLISVQR